MEIYDALRWLQNTSFAKTISENEILFPWIESVHVLAIVLVVGTISIVDLRLIGVASLDRAVKRLMGDVLRSPGAPSRLPRSRARRCLPRTQ